MLSIIGLLFVVGIVLILLVNLIDDPEQFINVALIGLTTGSVYALVALGYTLVYGILQLINFAHGDVFALCGLDRQLDHDLASSTSAGTRRSS